MEPQNPKVSVIVVTYNQQDTIGQTIESILMQRCNFRFEIQLSDDASSDGTSGICRRYAAAYPHIIRYHRNETNKGVRDNYFDALLRCNAPYIADCAGDDYWSDPCKLQKEADILDSDPSIGLVHTAWEYVDALTGAVTPSPTPAARAHMLKPKTSKGELFLPLLLNRGIMVIHLCTALYRKSIFLEAIQADPQMFRNPEFTSEDMLLNLLYAKESGIAYIPDVTLRYRTGHDSISSIRNHLRTFDFYFGSLKLSCHIARKYGIPDSTTLPVHSSDASFLFAQAYLGMDRTRVENLTAFMREHHIPLSRKDSILMRTLPFRPIWHCAAALKRIMARMRHR